VASQTFEAIVAGNHLPSSLRSNGHVSTVKEDDDMGQEKKGAKKKGPAKKTSRREREYNKRLVKL
jgi:hypothetical protein